MVYRRILVFLDDFYFKFLRMYSTTIASMFLFDYERFLGLFCLIVDP